MVGGGIGILKAGGSVGGNCAFRPRYLDKEIIGVDPEPGGGKKAISTTKGGWTRGDTVEEDFVLSGEGGGLGFYIVLHTPPACL